MDTHRLVCRKGMSPLAPDRHQPRTKIDTAACQTEAQQEDSQASLDLSHQWCPDEKSNRRFEISQKEVRNESLQCTQTRR